MNWDRFEAEQEAVQSLSALYEQAKKCQELHERAQMELPSRLQSFLGINGAGGGKSAPAIKATAHISPPLWPHPPKEAKPDWISIETREAAVTSVILALLRDAPESMRSRDLTQKVEEYLPNANSGSVANAGTRLVGEQTIERTEEGWKLIKLDKAGLIRDGRLWVPVSTLSKQEVAAHRREAILHLLKHYPTGLQTVQIVEQLRNCPWLHAPVNKDILKLDMETLQEEKKVRRRGNTKKWELAPAEKGEVKELST